MIYKYLILGPGGIKGYMHLGALFYLHEKGLLKNIETYIGVSIGSIISLLLNCGYTPSQIIIKTIIINIFNSCTIKDIWNNLKGGSVLSVEPIRIVLNHLMKLKFDKVLTLKELYEKTKKELYVVANNISKNEGLTYISYKSHPDLSATEAVLMSSSIPFIFPAYEYKDSLFVDGATVNPYPIDIVPLKEEEKVIGFYIDNKDDIKGKISFFNRIIDSPLREIMRRGKETYKKSTHVILETKVYDSIGLSLSLEDKIKMISDGYETIKFFFSFKELKE